MSMQIPFFSSRDAGVMNGGPITEKYKVMKYARELRFESTDHGGQKTYEVLTAISPLFRLDIPEAQWWHRCYWCPGADSIPSGEGMFIQAVLPHVVAITLVVRTELVYPNDVITQM